MSSSKYRVYPVSKDEEKEEILGLSCEEMGGDAGSLGEDKVDDDDDDDHHHLVNKPMHRQSIKLSDFDDEKDHGQDSQSNNIANQVADLNVEEEKQGRDDLEEEEEEEHGDGIMRMIAAKRAAKHWKLKRSTKVDLSNLKVAYPTRERTDITVGKPSDEKIKDLARKFQVVGRVVAASNTLTRDVSCTIDEEQEESECISTMKEDPSSLRPKTAKQRNRTSSRANRLKSVVDMDVSVAIDSMLATSKETLYDSFFSVIDYNHPKKLIWDWTIVLLTFYTVLTLPFFVAFPQTFKVSPVMIPLDVVTDVVFIVDIYFSFRTSFLDEDRYVVRESKEIMKRYLHGWFTIDVIAALPLELLAPYFGTWGEARHWLRINKLIRLTRVVKKLDDLILSGYGRILKLFGTFCVSAHMIACFYFALGRLQPSDVIGGSWIQAYELIDKPIQFQYLSSLYWAFATLATVGYGDITATSFYERIFALLTMFLGSILYALIFGTFTSLIQERDKNKSQFNEKAIQISQFCKSNGLPGFIKHRLLRYHETSWELRKIEANQVLEGVPKSAQIELMMFLYADLVVQVPIFSKCSKRFLEKVVLCFDHSIFLSGDYLIREGDLGTELYFVVKGYIEIYAYSGPAEQVASIDFDHVVSDSYYVVGRGPGAFIGEGALLYNSRRGASVLAVSPIVQTLCLTKESFTKCVEGSPEVLETIKGIADFRKKEGGSMKFKSSTSLRNGPNSSSICSSGSSTSYYENTANTRKSELQDVTAISRNTYKLNEDQHRQGEAWNHAEMQVAEDLHNRHTKFQRLPTKEILKKMDVPTGEPVHYHAAIRNTDACIMEKLSSLAHSFEHFAKTQNEKMAKLERQVQQATNNP